MINLAQRSHQKELMDRDDIPFEAMARTLRELNIINTRLGGHAITLSGVKQIIANKKTISICEIGCGGGDNLHIIHRYCKKKGIEARFFGIDLNENCIAFARQQYPDLPAQWICSDYARVEFGENKPDIIFSSLFCHHFTDTQLAEMMSWLQVNSRSGFFINDLQRHWLAYYLIKYITRFFSRSYLVKNDACISVSRGFHKNEWKQLLEKSGIIHYNIRWRWAFRYLVTCQK